MRAFQKAAFLQLHKLGIRFGIHVLPVHYYSPVANILELARTKPVWARKSELPGVAANLDEQVENLRAICLPYQKEYLGNNIYHEGAKSLRHAYGYIEAEALHGVIRHYRPRRVIEVGGGLSTYCLLKALRMNEEEGAGSWSMVSIEPYPSAGLRALEGTKLITEPVQRVPLELFADLGENDFLFIDSSHAMKPGSDVNHLILEVLPRLRPGVLVHFHDIHLPYDYPRDVLENFLHFNETSLLHAFLIFNNRIKIIFCMSQLHYERQDVLREVFPDYHPQADVNGLRNGRTKPFASIHEHFPSSLYFQVH
jgi:predicted O-methyltransferase YrrM